MGKGQVSNRIQGQKPGLSTGGVRVSSLSSTWVESEHEGDSWVSRGHQDGAVAVPGERRLEMLSHDPTTRGHQTRSRLVC
jgi:hypothetical protein